ncbi:hypothetical protein AVEN_244537-1 [Araneus ventricosus]|uniref:Uncharacterized protein n=1 Tax=Araneus ventricosus TaxID=182803 RepID=A0A4Y2F690_ARAVE|nr:hypothetical protein AVEN_244537-1 [Araneus ventricosus]
MGVQQSFTKFCCFLCEWNSRATDLHYIQKDWPPRMCLTPGKINVMKTPLVSPKKIILPALHLKLGIVKQLVEAMDTNKPAFTYLREKFPRLSEAKIKEGIFVGPQISDIFKDTKFENPLDYDEKQVWDSDCQGCTNFLGSIRSKYYEDLVHDMLALHQRFGCRMSLKLHFLDFQLEFFPANCGKFSDEHGERFHQNMSVIEQRYRRMWSASMLGDCCWMILRDNPHVEYKRKSKRTRHS